MSFNFTISVFITFFSGIRKVAPCLNNKVYRPHFVVKGDEEYIGVCFIGGAECELDKAISAVVLPIYENVHYDKLKPGTQFFVMEGDKIVGKGTVESICPL